MAIQSKLKPLLTQKIQDRGYSGIRAFAKAHGLNHSTIVKAMNGNSVPRRNIVERWCEALECTKQERIEIFHAAGYVAPDELEDETLVA